MWWNACMMVVLGTVATQGVTALFGNESVVIAPSNVMTQLVEITQSLCQVMPELVGCDAVNETLFQEQQHERADVGEYELSSSNPLLYLAVQHFSSLQQQNKELEEKNSLHTAQLAILTQEKARLEEVLHSLEGQRGHVRNPRDTEVDLRLLSPMEESTANLGSQFALPVGQHRVTADKLRPVDCSDHLLMGHTTSGVYEIYPFRCRCAKPVKVWCDMETDGGGWTVFLTRMNATPRETFNRTWNDYKEGFGNVTGEYWLGNEMLYTMTNSRAYSLRMDFKLTDGNLKWGEWPVFKVWNEKNKYKLEVPQYNGLSMIDHCFSLHNNRFFSAFDYDNDGNAGKNCALDINGGWWFNNCGALEATRPFSPGGELTTTCSYKLHNKKIPLKGSWLQLKIRPSICDHAIKAVYFNGYSCHQHND